MRATPRTVPHYAKVERIEKYLETGRYKLIFSDVQVRDPPVVSQGSESPPIQGHRYTTLAKLRAARVVADLSPGISPTAAEEHCPIRSLREPVRKLCSGRHNRRCRLAVVQPILS